MNILQSLSIISILLLSRLPSATAADVDVEFANKSSWTIQELYFSSTRDDEWGPDQLGHHVVEPGGFYELRHIPVGKYDIRIVDEDGDECIVKAVKVVADEKVSISDEDLLGCQAATEEG